MRRATAPVTMSGTAEEEDEGEEEKGGPAAGRLPLSLRLACQLGWRLRGRRRRASGGREIHLAALLACQLQQRQQQIMAQLVCSSVLIAIQISVNYRFFTCAHKLNRVLFAQRSQFTILSLRYAPSFHHFVQNARKVLRLLKVPGQSFIQGRWSYVLRRCGWLAISRPGALLVQKWIFPVVPTMQENMRSKLLPLVEL